MKSDPYAVRHNVSKQRFELGQGEDLAVVTYVKEDGRVFFDHTYVPDQFRGAGVGATLVRAALEEARQQGWKIVPSCWFVAKFIQRNPGFADLLAGH